MNKLIFNSCISLVVATLAVVLLTTPTFAATNQALGSIAGVSADLADSNIVTLNSQGLALVKRAFLADNTALDGGQTVGGEETLPIGTTVRFLIYVTNPTDLDVADVRVNDQLTGFTFVPAGAFTEANFAGICDSDGDLTSCSPAEELNLLTSLLGTANKTPGADADSMSYDTPTTTVNVGGPTTDPNGTAITATANQVWGMVFEVTID